VKSIQSTRNCSHRRYRRALFGALYVVVLIFNSARASTFDYDSIVDPILSASFTADFAALTAHRTLFGVEVNSLWLIESAGNGMSLDLSAALFGLTEALQDPALLDQGQLGTGLVTVALDPAFFSALASGHVDLMATLTDTFDGLFAIDFFALTIVTASGSIDIFLDSNNGFGIGLADGAQLPGLLPGPIPVDATGTGFDETLSSISFQPIPTVESLSLLLLGLLVITPHYRRRALMPTPTENCSRPTSR